MLDFWGSSKIALRPKGTTSGFKKTLFFVKNYLHIREPFQMKNLILDKKQHITGSQKLDILTVLKTNGSI